MNDGIDARDRTAQARRACDVALDELATPGSQPGSPAPVTDEAADGKVAATTPGPTVPMGAARPAKYPIQKPRRPASLNACRASGAK